MTGEIFAEIAKTVEKEKTAYARGAFGAPLNKKNALRYKVDEDPDRFAFDCCGLWHAIASGWCADKSHVYGGTQVYKAGNGICYGEHHIPDIGADGCFSQGYIQDISNDMNHILPGEIMWIPGHNGIYVGNGFVVECTPKWTGGVQISQMKDPTSPKYRAWLQHGKLPFLDYTEDDTQDEIYITCPCCGARFKKL